MIHQKILSRRRLSPKTQHGNTAFGQTSKKDVVKCIICAKGTHSRVRRMKQPLSGAKISFTEPIADAMDSAVLLKAMWLHAHSLHRTFALDILELQGLLMEI